MSKLEQSLQLSIEYVAGYLPPEDFDRVALSLYELHREMNPVYAKYATKDIDSIHSWKDIPLMPIGEFKKGRVGLEITSEMPDPSVLFKSSGTTQKDRSEHYMRDTEHYRMAIARGLRDFVLKGNMPSPQYRVICFTPELDNSSLYYMMQYVSQLTSWNGEFERFDGMTNPARVVELLDSMEKDSDHPYILFGTSLAFYDLVSNLPEGVQNLTLPEGSVLIETGGWKGRDISMSPIDLSIRLRDLFGIDGMSVMREYSMSELSSQMYGWSTLRRFNSLDLRTVYWTSDQLGYRTVDPLSQKDVKEEEQGIIGFVDLANIWSCPFVLTEDLGVIYSAGTLSDGLELIGRAVDAPEKGCSLTYSEAMLRE